MDKLVHLQYNKILNAVYVYFVDLLYLIYNTLIVMQLTQLCHSFFRLHRRTASPRSTMSFVERTLSNVAVLIIFSSIASSAPQCS